jgi:hypothetical protein
MSCRWVLPARSILGRTGTSSSVRACGYFSMGVYARAAPPGVSASAMGGGTQLGLPKIPHRSPRPAARWMSSLILKRASSVSPLWPEKRKVVMDVTA